MAYADPEKQRAYQREYQRQRRRGAKTAPGSAELPPSFRLRTAQDLVDLVQEQVEAVRQDPRAGTLEKARCITAMVAVALRVLEQRDLTGRVEALERALRVRKSPGRAA